MLVGLDLGTTNIKAVAVGADGRVAARASTPVKLYHVEGNGVEQDIEEIWSATIRTLCALGALTDLRSVKALGISSQGGAMQLLDGHDRPIGRVISWLDGRSCRFNDDVAKRYGTRWLTEHTGHGTSGITIGQILRLRESQPDAIHPPNRIGYVGDVIVGRLCGRRAHDATSLSLALLLNPSLGEADPDVLKLIGITQSQLPDLLPIQTAAAGLLDTVAERTRLPRGIPVSVAIHDQYAAALGAGARNAGDVMFGAGTAWVLLGVTDHLPQQPPPTGFICPHPAGGHGVILSMVNGGSSFAWALDIMGLKERPAPEIEALIGGAPAGSNGVRFVPFMVSGAAIMASPTHKAGWFGLSLGHESCHLLRSVIEGLVLELGRTLRFLPLNAEKPRQLFMCGPAASSPTTAQIVADVTGASVRAIAEPEVSAFGAAIVARILAEPEMTLTDAVEQMKPDARPYEPGAIAACYQELLETYVAEVEGKK